MVCPNISSFEVSQGEFANKSLGVSLDRTQAGLDFEGVHAIYNVEISQYFTAEHYLENKYQRSIVLA